MSTSTTPKAQYTFADGSESRIRPLVIVYSNGRDVTCDYGTTGGIDDRASRIAAIVDQDDTHLVGYAYLGARTFVEEIRGEALPRTATSDEIEKMLRHEKNPTRPEELRRGKRFPSSSLVSERS